MSLSTYQNLADRFVNLCQLHHVDLTKGEINLPSDIAFIKFENEYGLRMEQLPDSLAVSILQNHIHPDGQLIFHLVGNVIVNPSQKAKILRRQIPPAIPKRKSLPPFSPSHLDLDAVPRRP